MFAFFLILLILDSVILGVVVLLQSGKGGGLAAMGGGASTDTFLGGRQAVTVLTKMSWWCGALFLAFSLILAGMSTRGGGPTSVLQGQLAPPAPINTAPLPLDVQPPAGEGAAQPSPVPPGQPEDNN
ncbi:MAG TPA: preprotein translocase subunit SecG [Gemmatimonadales bacterium]